MSIHCFIFEIQIIKNGFTSPISYRVFRETGPRAYYRNFTVGNLFIEDSVHLQYYTPF